MLLTDLPNGAHATVEGVVAASSEVDAVTLRRLGELGFIPGEPLRLLRRGPGGREPLAVMIGETMFALRLLGAKWIEVSALPCKIQWQIVFSGRSSGPLPSRAASPCGP